MVIFYFKGDLDFSILVAATRAPGWTTPPTEGGSTQAREAYHLSFRYNPVIHCRR